MHRLGLTRRDFLRFYRLSLVEKHPRSAAVSKLELANTGAAASPSILGTIGIASGRAKARNLRRVKPIQFERLKGYGAVYLPFSDDAAIYEQFYTGSGASCAHARDDDADEDEGENV